MELSGKVAVITGSTKGIGKSIAYTFSKEGALVVVNGRRQETVNLVVKDIEKRDGKAIGIAADIGEREQVNRLFAEVYRLFGKIDILVNNASVYEIVSMLNMTEKQWDRTMQVNLKGVFYCIKSVLKPMIKQGFGNIINIVSVAAKTGGKLPVAHYAASKAALLCLTKSLATEFAIKGIRVNAICPGIINTDMAKDIIQTFSRLIPLKRIGQPEEIAEAALFFASDRSSYITGEIMDVNGGLFMD